MEVPSLEQFNELLKRVEQLEKQLKESECRRDQYPLALEWVSGDQARQILGKRERPICKQKLKRLWEEGYIERRQFGRSVKYKLESIRTFLNGTHLDTPAVELRNIGATSNALELPCQ